MKALNLLINSKLPEDLRDYNREYSKKDISNLMAQIADKYPEKYAELSKEISDIGRKASYIQGETLTLADMAPPIDKEAILNQMDQEINLIDKTIKNKDERLNAKLQIYQRYSDILEKEVSRASKEQGTNLGRAVLSGARGNPFQLKAMVATPSLYVDYKDEPIPIFVRRSFGEGLRPHEYLASAFGVRKSVLCLHHESLVRMADGTSKKLNEIKIGDYVLGSDKEGNTFPVKVLNVFDQGEQPVYKYTFARSKQDNRELICTANHKILSNHLREFNTENVRKHRNPNYVVPEGLYHKKYIEPVGYSAKKFYAVLPVGYTNKNLRSEPDALLIGLLTGDGCLTDIEDYRIGFSCDDDLLISEINHQLDNLTFKSYSDKDLSYYLVKKDYNAAQNKSIIKGVQGFVKEKRDPIRVKLINEDLFGKYSFEKQLPKTINEWDNDSIAKYLAGYIAADGSIFEVDGVTPLTVSVASTSKQLIEGIKDILEFRFGIYSTSIYEEFKGGFGEEFRKRPIYKIAISSYSSLLRFEQIAKYIPGVKRQKFYTLFANLGLIQNNPYPKAARIDSEFIGLERCMDLEVDHPDHLFVLSNGIIVSNSTKLATADAGDVGKQMTQVTTPLMVTEDDCGTANGIDVSVDDDDTRGSVLAKEVAGIPAGTVIDRHVQNVLRKKGVEKAIVRSALVCQAKEGLCSKCIGTGPRNQFYPVGFAAGVTAAQAACLEENTEVLMADYSTKKIKDIHVGDLILGSDLKGNTKVVQVLGKYDNGIQDCYKTTFRKDNKEKTIISITSTLNHRVLGYKGLKKKNSFSLVDLRQPENENHKFYVKLVDGNSSFIDQVYVGKKQVYDLYVDHPDHLFVLKNMMVVHNSEPLAQGSLNCFAEGTMVRMADGTENPIEEIQLGDLVLGADKKGNTFATTVTGKWDQGIQPTFEYELTRNSDNKKFYVECTEIHGFLTTENKVVPIGEIAKKNLRIKTPLYLKDTKRTKSEKTSLAYLIGVMLGDGIRNRGKGYEDELRFSCACENQIESLQELYSGEFKFNKRARSHDYGICDLKPLSRAIGVDGRFKEMGFANRLKQELYELDLLTKYCYEKRIPKEVFSWSIKDVLALIAGYIATDGSINVRGVTFGSASKQLLADLKQLFEQKLGIFSSNLTLMSKAKNSKIRKRDLWGLAISRLSELRKLQKYFEDYDIIIPGVKWQKFQDRCSIKLKRKTKDVEYSITAIKPKGNNQCWDITVAHNDSLFVLSRSLSMGTNTKHSGGGFSGGKQTFAGFDIIDQFIQSPKVFPHRAAVAELEGKITKIEPAPQGGHYIYVNDQRHYSLPGYEVLAKVGDKVEEGDQLSDGVVDPADVIRLRGLGEGRRYYAERLKQIFDDSNISLSRRNAEVIARAAIDHVDIEDPDGLGGYLPGDTVSYNTLSTSYVPSEKAHNIVLDDRYVGKYLEAPMLHYSIGTKLTPKIIGRLREAGYKEAFVSDEKPQFTPVMQRMRAAGHNQDDWLAKMHTSYLKTNLVQDAIRGLDTNVQENIHFAPRMAIGEKFGERADETGKF